MPYRENPDRIPHHPTREAAKNTNLPQLVYQHDNLLFGGWDTDENKPGRKPGILERLARLELVMKLGSTGIAFLVLRAIGVPTENIGKFFEYILKLIGG